MVLNIVDLREQQQNQEEEEEQEEEQEEEDEVEEKQQEEPMQMKKKRKKGNCVFKLIGDHAWFSQIIERVELLVFNFEGLQPNR